MGSCCRCRFGRWGGLVWVVIVEGGGWVLGKGLRLRGSMGSRFWVVRDYCLRDLRDWRD
jgi:hypothetical protein